MTSPENFFCSVGEAEGVDDGVAGLELLCPLDEFSDEQALSAAKPNREAPAAKKGLREKVRGCESENSGLVIKS